MKIYDMKTKKYIDYDKVIITYKTFGHLNLHNALESFNEIPTADVWPVVRGKWIDESIKSIRYYCSVCQDRFDYTWHFCPSCGADMRGINE